MPSPRSRSPSSPRHAPTGSCRDGRCAVRARLHGQRRLGGSDVRPLLAVSRLKKPLLAPLFEPRGQAPERCKDDPGRDARGVSRRLTGGEASTTYDGAMAAGRDAATHAATLYRRMFAALRLRVREIEAEAGHLRRVEQAGESGETPFIAILGLLFFLIPIVLLVGGLAFAAYYLAR